MHYMVDLDGHLREECLDDLFVTQPVAPTAQQCLNCGASRTFTAAATHSAPVRPMTPQDAAPDRPTTLRGIAFSTKEQKKSGRPTGN